MTTEAQHASHGGPGPLSGPEGFAVVYSDGSCNQYPRLFADRPDRLFFDWAAEMGLKPVGVVRVRPKPDRLAEWDAGLPA